MAEQNTARSALEQELNKLGENLGNLVRALWESEERKAIERELSANLERLNKRVCEVVEKVRANEVVAGVQRSVKEAWETAHGPQILNEVQAGLADTLRKLNEEIARRIQPAQEVQPDEGTPRQTRNGDPIGVTKPE
ncbi:MAG: hypothetical protein J7601_04615 [Chloroflexi bacterium]|jgi:SMC interacting uncharacterized protein involved in chromosome segregation|nr:hypothetical protein [Chloroflexota bacterium]